MQFLPLRLPGEFGWLRGVCLFNGGDEKSHLARQRRVGVEMSSPPSMRVKNGRESKGHLDH